MAITQAFMNMDAYFRFSEGDKIIINHLSYIDSNDMNFIQNKLTTVYDTDTISMVPCCDCGHTSGRYLLGMMCPDCNTICVDPKEKTKPLLWFEKLDNNMPFINPAFWNNLAKLLSRSVDYLRWLSDPQYNPGTTIPNYILLAKKEVLGDVRGYYELVNNLGPLLDYLVNSTELKSKTTYDELVCLREIYIRHSEDVLSSYLPILNKKLFVIENTTKGKYTNLVLGDIIDAITMWLKAADDNVSLRKKSIATGTVLAKLADMYIKYYDKYLLKKPGIFRKHVYGARSHFTFRTVISASKGKHKHNEVIPPWVISVTTYRPHLLNKLIARKFSYKEADKLLNTAITQYDPLIAELQNELIAESPYRQGLPLLVTRNPSLLQGSSQFMFIPRFNQDPRVLTTSFSPLAAKACNADFDGDELNFYPLMDNVMVSEFKTLRPFYSIPDLTAPCTVSKLLTLDTPNNSILANYLWDKRANDGDNSLYEML